jgi:hypothetical protein
MLAYVKIVSKSQGKAGSWDVSTLVGGRRNHWSQSFT